MAEIHPDPNWVRWYEVRWPGDMGKSRTWAEKYFGDHSEAFRYYEKRQAELTPRRVHTPLHSREDDGIWVVCVEPSWGQPAT